MYCMTHLKNSSNSFDAYGKSSICSPVMVEHFSEIRTQEVDGCGPRSVLTDFTFVTGTFKSWGFVVDILNNKRKRKLFIQRE